MIGLLAGIFGQLGFFRSRPNTPGVEARGRGAIVVRSSWCCIGFYGFLPFYTDGSVTFFDADARPTSDRSSRSSAGRSASASSRRSSALVLLFVRRDVGAAYVALAGPRLRASCRAIISAPIAAIVFGGVTGAGTDVLVAAFQQAGSDLQHGRPQAGPALRPDRQDLRVLHRLPHPAALSRRFVARFPQGEQASA